MPRTIPFDRTKWEYKNPGNYAPTTNKGKKVPGWEDVNVTRLATDINVSFRYLLGVLCGQRNCTLALLQRVAAALGMELTELVGRMQHAYALRTLETANPLDKSERRRIQSEKRAIAGR